MKLVIKYCDVLMREKKKEEVLALLKNEMRCLWKTSKEN